MSSVTYDSFFYSSFTGHEHLYDFGLINMNGRMYDPLLSSFLSPDNYMQDPTSQQGFNRYAYCMYNPLKYVDPTGERPLGWVSTTYQYEQMARRINSEWQGVYDDLIVKHRIALSMANSIYSEGSDACGAIGANGSGNHGSGGGEGNQNEPSDNGHGDGDPTNTTDSNTGGIPGSSEDNPTSSHLLADKCDWWYEYGDNKTMYVKASKSMFWFISKENLTKIGDNTYTINLFTSPYMFINLELAMALGQITLTDMGNNMYHIEDDTYDFNVKNGEYFSNWRNFATSCAGILHGGINEPTFLLYPATYWGGEFKIHFINDVYIKP